MENTREGMVESRDVPRFRHRVIFIGELVIPSSQMSANIVARGRVATRVSATDSDGSVSRTALAGCRE